MTKRKRYKRFSPEFTREALKRASEEGVTDIIVCEELGISARRGGEREVKSGLLRATRVPCVGHFPVVGPIHPSAQG